VRDRWIVEPAARTLPARLYGRQGVHNIVSDPIRVVDEEMRDVPRDGETPGHISLALTAELRHLQSCRCPAKM
jgi:hypothetical protein